MTSIFQRLLPVSMMAAGVALVTVSIFSAGFADADRRGRGDKCGNEVGRYQTEIQRLNSEIVAYQGALQELSVGLDSVERIVSRRVSDQRIQNKLLRVVKDARDRSAQYFAPAPATQPTITVTDPYATGHQPSVTVTVDPYGGADLYATPQPMTPRELARLSKAVTDASFTNERIELVRAAAQHNLFTVDQVIALIKICSFDKTKIEIAALLYPNVVDIKAWYRVYQALDFQSSRDKLRQRVERR